MAMNAISTDARNAMCDALVTLVDGGSAGGTIEIYDAGFVTLLALCTFSTTAFGASSGGVATAAAITNDSAANASGTAAVCRISSSNAADTPLNQIWDGTCGVGTGDLQLNTTGIVLNDVVSISSFLVTMPAA